MEEIKVNCECLAGARRLEPCDWCDSTRRVSVYPGDPIVYAPPHAHQILMGMRLPDFRVPGVEWGFVTSVRAPSVFCRYFAELGSAELSTKDHSVATPPGSIYKLYMSDPRTKPIIRQIMATLGYEYIERLNTFMCKE